MSSVEKRQIGGTEGRPGFQLEDVIPVQEISIEPYWASTPSPLPFVHQTPGNHIPLAEQADDGERFSGETGAVGHALKRTPSPGTFSFPERISFLIR